MTGYRAASRPVPTVTHLEVGGHRARAFYVVAGATLIGPALLQYADASIGSLIAAICAATVLAIVGRYGRTRARLELEPGSGEITLVTHGFLARATRRTFQVEDIERIWGVPITPGGAGLVMPVIDLVGGETVDVFGRPLGLGKDEARWILSLIERQLANARRASAVPRTRVAPASTADEPEDDEDSSAEESPEPSASRD